MGRHSPPKIQKKIQLMKAVLVHVLLASKV